MAETPPEVSIEKAPRRRASGISIIWLLPIIALAVALWVAWTTYNARGPLIVVEFKDGAGIEAGETELKYRDISVGRVEKLGFGEGLSTVLAYIRVDKDVAPYIDSSSIFWIVEPEVTAQGITGLSTVLSGVYIEGSWDNEIGSSETNFQGASQAPLIRPGRSGLQIALRTTGAGQLTDNAPILFRGIEVGQVGKAQISPTGGFGIVEALIYDEYRGLINSSTRFWDTSGFTVSVGPSGAEIDFSSLASLVGGGITFDTFVSGGDRVQDGDIFEIHYDEETARASLFRANEVDPLKLSVIFEENVSGLIVGAPVELRGLRIGEVETLGGVVDYNQFGDSRVRLNVTLSIQPARLGLPGDTTSAAAFEFLQEQVANGLRARLASASLLTGGLKVEFVSAEDAPPARLMDEVNDLPRMPTTDSVLADTAATVEGVFTRINDLPIEELLNSAIGFLSAAETLISSEDLRETPADVRVLLGDLSDLVNSEDVRNVPASLNATLTRVERLVAQLEEQQVAAKLIAALDAAETTANAVSTSIEGVPALIAQIESVAAKADALAVEDLIAELTKLSTSAETLIGSDDVAAVPAALTNALKEATEILSKLQSGGAIENINRTLAATGTASDQFPELVASLQITLDNASKAASDVSTSIEGVPELIAQIEAVAAKAEQIELQELVDEIATLVRSADALVASDDTRAVPAALKGALDQLNATLAELREGGAIQNVNRALESTRIAADNVALSAQDLPTIIARLERLFVQAGRTIEGYNQGDRLTRSAEETLRDISKAADALAKLARTIERNPNSLLLGR